MDLKRKHCTEGRPSLPKLTHAFLRLRFASQNDLPQRVHLGPPTLKTTFCGLQDVQGQPEAESSLCPSCLEALQGLLHLEDLAQARILATNMLKHMHPVPVAQESTHDDSLPAGTEGTGTQQGAVGDSGQ